MSPIIAMLIQVAVQLLLAWIKQKVPVEGQPAVLKDVEDALAEAQAKRSPQPLKDLLRRLRGV